MKKNLYFILSGCILAGAVFLRLYHIASVPLGLHIDEAGLGLNAWSIANFGTDRYGNPIPVCPSNFYGEQSAFYTYFCAFLVRLFGLNLYTLRLPGVIMGILTVIFGGLLIREKWGEKGMLAGMALIGIFPWFIMNCRFALDCNAMLGMLTVSLYGLMRLLKKAQRHPERSLYGHFFLVGILFGITLYTYIVAAIVISLFCILWGIYYLFCGKGQRLLRFRRLLFMALPLCVLALPLVMVVCVNYFDLEPVVTPFFSIPKMAENRTEEVVLSASAMFGKLKNLTFTLTTDGKYGSSDRYWTMYRWSVIFIAVGGLCSIRQALRDFRERKTGPDVLMLLTAFAEIVMFLLCGHYNYHINGIFIALAYFCVNGILCLFVWIRRKSVRLAYTAALLCLYGVSFAGFAREYFTPETAAFQVYGGVHEALSLLTAEQREREIYVLDEVAEIYFLSAPIPPADFSAGCDELGYIKDHGNLHFHDPSEFRRGDIIVCNKHSGRYGAVSGMEIDGVSCSVLETEHYCVVYFSGQ